MNSGITLVDVRSEAMDAIQKLKSGAMDLKTAQQIKGLLDTVIMTAKTQIDFLNAIPKPLKDSLTKENVLAIAGTLRDRDEDIDITLHEIDERNKKPYEASKNPLND